MLTLLTACEKSTTMGPVIGYEIKLLFPQDAGPSGPVTEIMASLVMVAVIPLYVETTEE